MHGRHRRGTPTTLSKVLTAEVILEEFVGQSRAFVDLIQRITHAASANVSVLICGETGTGKELCARAIHYLSSRGKFPFVVENCGRLPSDLIANEFFGHEAGAFTGATKDSIGLIGQAQGGTLVLDEIDSLPIAAQAVLLRFLQEKRYQPLGGTQSEQADVRVLACTNVNLAAKVEQGLFRRDLFHRLKVVELTLAPLRERRSDIALLAKHFVAKYAKEFDQPVRVFTSDCIAKLESYDWPGNVRELEGLIQEALVLTKTADVLRPEDLRVPANPLPTANQGPFSFNDAKAKAVHEFELAFLQEALDRAKGNISVAARDSGLHKGTLWHLLQKHHLLPRLQQWLWLAASDVLEFALRQAC